MPVLQSVVNEPERYEGQSVEHVVVIKVTRVPAQEEAAEAHVHASGHEDQLVPVLHELCLMDHFVHFAVPGLDLLFFVF
jgi:hypothetical protein